MSPPEAPAAPAGDATTGASHAGAARPIDWLEAGFLLIFVVVASTSAVAMALVGAGRFRLVPLVILAVSASIAATFVALRSVRRETRICRADRASVAVTLGLVVGGAALFARPAEFLFEGADGSVYVAIARILERHGTPFPIDPLVAGVAPLDRAVLFPPSPPPVLLDRFPGGLQATPDGELRPNFLHLFPAWMAAVELAAGFGRGFFVNAVFGVLSLVGLWLLGRRLSSRLAGALAASLLAVSFAEVWFARFPSSEVLTQFLALAGVAAAVIAIDTGLVAAASCAGIAFGLMAFTRLDSMVLVTPLVASAIAAAPLFGARGRAWIWCAALFALTTTGAIVYTFLWSEPYTMRVLNTIVGYAADRPGNLAFAAVVAAATVLGLRAAARAQALSPVLLAGVICAGVSVLVFLAWKDVTRGYFVRLLSPPGALMGLAGLTLFPMRQAGMRTMPVLILVLAGAAYLRTPMDERVMPWTFRRYVPILLPLALLGVAHLVSVARGRLRGAAIAATVALGVWFGWQTWPIVRSPVMQGVADEVRRVAGAVPQDALVIWEPSTTSHLALAMQFESGREGLVVPETDHRDGPLRDVIARAVSAGRPVRLIVDDAHGSASRPLWREELDPFDVEFVDSRELRYTSIATSRTIFPRVIAPVARRLDVYAIGPRGETAPSHLPLRIDVGAHDFANLLGGFYPAQLGAGTTSRWSHAVARVRMPPHFPDAASGVVLALRLATGRVRADTVDLDVEWNGHLIGRLHPTRDFEVYRLPVSADIRGGASASSTATAVLTLRATTFIPRDAGQGDDGRALGVLVDWIDVTRETDDE